ncbi:MAG: DUF1574 family protein [Bacteroidales bacterium]|nr:DUF1574 family protein [Bacteroidales bacterium]
MNQGPSRFNKMIYGHKGGNKEQIIILGDSRAEHHYNSELISAKTGKSVYNYGSDGQSVFFNYAVLRKLLDSYTPEIVIYEVAQTEFEYSEDTYDRLSYFLPVHNKYAEKILEKHAGSFRLFISRLFNSYKYNSTVFIILKSYLSPKEYLAGYQPLGEKLDVGLFSTEPAKIVDRKTEYLIDSMKITYFEQIIQLSKDYNFEIDFFISPTLFQTENEPLFSTLNKSLSNYKYSVHNYLNDSTYKVSSFADPIHLNSEGADDYTKQIISVIK